MYIVSPELQDYLMGDSAPLYIVLVARIKVSKNPLLDRIHQEGVGFWVSRQLSPSGLFRTLDISCFLLRILKILRYPIPQPFQRGLRKEDQEDQKARTKNTERLRLLSSLSQ